MTKINIINIINIINKNRAGHSNILYLDCQKLHIFKSPLTITSGLLSHSETF